MGLLQKLFYHEYKELKKFEKIADQICAKEEEIQKLSDKVQGYSLLIDWHLYVSKHHGFSE